MLKVAFHPLYKHSLPEGHRFPMEKYELLPQQLLHEGTCEPENFFEPDLSSKSTFLTLQKNILAVHDTDYYEKLINLTLDRGAIRKIGFPLSEGLVTREHIIAEGTILGCDYALKHGVAMNVAGGTHHAYTDRGEGFCMLNDQAIAAKYLLKQYGNGDNSTSENDQVHIKKILIVDLDVHQGNGTAEIFQKEEAVFTFSMHGAGNYPFKKEKSDLDIAVPDGSGDDIYLKRLKETLPKLIETEKPDFIFYLSGVDILETDKLGRLSCTVEGCKERDNFVFKLCKDLDIPVQVSMGGGYSPEIKTILEAHANTFRLAQQVYF